MPAQKNQLTLQPPILGVNRRAGFQSQPPFSAYRATNTWPADPLTGRSVLGTRPAIVPFASPIGSGAVNMLVRVNGVSTGKPLQSMLAARGSDFSWYNASGTWTAATGAGASLAETDVALFPATFLQEVFIPQFDDKPWVFNYDAGTVIELVETAGTIPNDLRMFVTWQGALWGAGALSNPHILYASRVGDAYDWDFAAIATDTAGAFFTAGENEGRLRGPITALMPQTADTMIVSTTEGLVAMRRHPRDGGIFSDVGATYVLGQGAWCKVPGDTLFFMTRLGLMMLAPTPGAVPTPVSVKTIPDELVGLAYDYEDPTISLEYDSRFNGIWITDRGTTSPSPQAWFYDLNAGGYHQLTPAAYPYRLVEFFEAVTENTSGVLFAGSGYSGLGQPDRLGAETFDADVIIGPFAISANPTTATKIVQARVTFGGDTPTIGGAVAFAVGATAEETIQRAEDESHQYEIDLLELESSNGVCYPHVAGHAGAIRITYTGGRATIEEITLTLVTAGVVRLVKYKAPSICRGYAAATPQFAPDAALGSDDGIEVIDLADLPQDWWDLANSNGTNIRVTDDNNNFIPFDVVDYSKSAETGELWLRRALPLTPTAVRCWVCDQNVSRFPYGSPFSQPFAYPPWMLAIWPQPYGVNRVPLKWPTTPTIDTFPQDDIIDTPQAEGGGGDPKECPTQDTLHFFVLFSTVGSGDYYNASPGTADIAFSTLLGLEFTNVCTDGAGEAGDIRNDSVAFMWAGGSEFFNPDDLVFVTARQTYSAELQTTSRSYLTNFYDNGVMDDVNLLHVEMAGGTNSFDVELNGQTMEVFSFGSSQTVPTHQMAGTLAKNMFPSLATIATEVFDLVDQDVAALLEDHVSFRRPADIKVKMVTGEYDDAVEDALNHLRAQLEDVTAHWGDWTWTATGSVNLELEQ